MTIQFYHIISKIKKKKKKKKNQIVSTADAVSATEESWLWQNVLNSVIQFVFIKIGFLLNFTKVTAI